MGQTKFRFLGGVAVSLSFVGSLLLCGQMIGSSSPDYKNMVDDVFGVHHETAGSDSLDSYAFRSDYGSTTEMLGKRADIATRLSAGDPFY